MTENSTELSYWLNWRFLCCALVVLFSIFLAIFLIWRYEDCRRKRRGVNDGQEAPCDKTGELYEDEAWKTCAPCINPIWLLGFRIVSFVILLTLIVGNTVADSGAIFCYYTQWTFALVTVYFGFASGFSIYGYWQSKSNSRNQDMDKGMYTTPLVHDYEGPPTTVKSLYDNDTRYQTGNFWGYFLQVIYQIAGGAVVITDVVFWLIIFPFLTAVDYKLTFYLIVMHSVNILLLGDTILNSMVNPLPSIIKEPLLCFELQRFPMFRFGYFILWSATYIIFQWIIHACIYFWWPYTFLDLSSSYGPLWYLGLALLHIPCYGLFALIVRLKQWWLSKYLADSYEGTR